MVALTLQEAAQVEAQATQMLLTIERKWLAVRATIDSIDKTDVDDATIDSIDKTDGDDAAGSGKIFCAMPRASMPPGFVRMASHIPFAALGWRHGRRVYEQLEPRCDARWQATR